jgi:holo-[acyl-carrier protein] synthase
LITGIGIDLCSIPRLAESLARTPNLLPRIFHESEQSLPINSLAARFAAKEALAKAIGNPKLLVWNEIEIVKDDLGKPSFVFHGNTKLELEKLNVRCLLSLSHELELATAMVVLEAL